jgi:IPT/TIG domain
MELVDKDYYLPATVALNSYSWVDTDFKYVPYGITDIQPNSGPISGNTDVIIVGKGFNEDL